MTAFGRGIRNAKITIEGGVLSEPRRFLTGPFGYYRFDNLDAGQTYVVSVGTKRYTFGAPSRTVNLDADAANVDFVADPPQDAANITKKSSKKKANYNKPKKEANALSYKRVSTSSSSLEPPTRRAGSPSLRAEID